MDGIWTTDELIDSLSKLPVLLPVVLRGVDAQSARVRPAEGEWSTVEVIGHLVDVEERALMRIASSRSRTTPN
ncbi:MAG: DinB family protein [Thermomicrobiales bacterium]